MLKLSNDPVIVAFARTPIGKYAGALKDLRPDDMLALSLKEACRRSGIDPKDIDEIVAGCANQAGEDNRNIARMAQLLADLPAQASAITLNRLCASGLDAVIDAARKIALGEHQVVIAGGVESMTRAPWIMPKAHKAYPLGAPSLFDSSLGWRFFNEKMHAYTPPEHNGVTAERLAEKYQISRLKQDHFALRSHQKALEAQRSGFLAAEIFALNIEHDEGPRPDTSLEKLSGLKAAFMPKGSVTAGNSSGLSDGAAALVITSHAYAKANRLNVLARIVGFASAGLNPQIMGLGPVPATKKLLSHTGLSLADFSLIEINEAFSAQVLAVIEELNLDEERVNSHGGAIALGHPLACSGARLVMTLINSLRQSKTSLGLATLCVGVGQGLSIAIEAL